MVKLLYLLDTTGTGAGGGAERLAVNVLGSLDESVYDRHICFTRPSRGALYDQVRRSGVKIFHLNRRSRYDVLPWLRLVRFIRREGIDIIHSHKHGSNFWGAVLSFFVRRPVLVAHEHSWSYSGNRVRLLTDRFLIGRRAARMIAVSDADREAMVEVERIDPGKIVLIPNGIPDESPEDVDRVRDELGLPAGTPLLTCIGVRPVKRLDLVVRALALVREQQPEAQLVAIGGHRVPDGLRELVAELGLEEHVHLVGERHDIARLLAATDVAVLASDREGMPLSILEYMAAGCAIVATRVGGIPAMLRDGVDGVLVAPGDEHELAHAVASLLRDPQRRRELGASARSRQSELYSLAAVVRRTDDLYRELLEGRTA
jgi:glycosyltransferase involved in cell wall biosynthesis